MGQTDQLSQLDAASLAVLEPSALFNSQDEMRSFYVRCLEVDLEKEMIRIDTTMTPHSGISPPYTLDMHWYPYISPLTLTPLSQ